MDTKKPGKMNSSKYSKKIFFLSNGIYKLFQKNVFQQFLKNLSNIPDLQKHFFLTSKMPLNLKEKIYSYVG